MLKNLLLRESNGAFTLLQGRTETRRLVFAAVQCRGLCEGAYFGAACLPECPRLTPIIAALQLLPSPSPRLILRELPKPTSSPPSLRALLLLVFPFALLLLGFLGLGLHFSLTFPTLTRWAPSNLLRDQSLRPHCESCHFLGCGLAAAPRFHQVF